MGAKESSDSRGESSSSRTSRSSRPEMMSRREQLALPRRPPTVRVLRSVPQVLDRAQVQDRTKLAPPAPSLSRAHLVEGRRFTPIGSQQVNVERDPRSHNLG